MTIKHMSHTAHFYALYFFYSFRHGKGVQYSLQNLYLCFMEKIKSNRFETIFEST